MQSYDPPPATDGLTPAEAQMAVNKMNADFGSDPQHPFYYGNHPQHKDFVDYSRRLHTIIAEGTNAAQEAREQEQVRALLEGDTPKQRALRKEAAEEMAALVALGFEEVEIDARIRPDQVTALRMQRLAAEGDFNGLRPILSKELSALHAPASTMALFGSYVNAPDDLDPDLRAGVGEQLIAWIDAANEKRYGQPKPGALQEDAAQEEIDE